MMRHVRDLGLVAWGLVRRSIYMGRLKLARAGWMGRWWQVVGVEGKKEGGELSLKKVALAGWPGSIRGILCANSFELYPPTNITTWSHMDECKVGRTPWSAADAHVGLPSSR
jgi:hypothetical protein